MEINLVFCGKGYPGLAFYIFSNYFCIVSIVLLNMYHKNVVKPKTGFTLEKNSHLFVLLYYNLD